MKTKLEKALFTQRMEDIRKNIDRIYFGNEFCENLLPTLDILRKWYFYSKANKKEFTFVTPFVTNAGLQNLESLLTFLNAQEDVEVVFNDWGVFKLMKDTFKNLNLVLGRLLTKQRRDPRMLKIFLGKQKIRETVSPDKKIKTILFPKKVPHTLFEHYRASVINVGIFQEYLLSQSINRVEIDNLIWGMDITVNKKIGVSIYLPYGYITTSRMCGKLTLTYGACKKECKKYFLRLRNKDLPVPFYCIGNTVFYKSKVVSKDHLARSGINRIVYQPRMPF
jgi:hypothetical protein